MLRDDMVKLYELKHGRLIVDRRFVLEVFQHDFMLGSRLYKNIVKNNKRLMKKYATNAT